MWHGNASVTERIHAMWPLASTGKQARIVARPPHNQAPYSARPATSTRVKDPILVIHRHLTSRRCCCRPRFGPCGQLCVRFQKDELYEQPGGRLPALLAEVVQVGGRLEEEAAGEEARVQPAAGGGGMGQGGVEGASTFLGTLRSQSKLAQLNITCRHVGKSYRVTGAFIVLVGSVGWHCQDRSAFAHTGGGSNK